MDGIDTTDSARHYGIRPSRATAPRPLEGATARASAGLAERHAAQPAAPAAREPFNYCNNIQGKADIPPTSGFESQRTSTLFPFVCGSSITTP